MSLGNYDQVVLGRVIHRLDAAADALMEEVDQARRFDIAGDLQDSAIELEILLGTSPLNISPQRSKTVRRRASSCARL